MKKLLTGFTVCLLLSGTAFGYQGIFEIKAGYFTPTDSDFKDIYGSGYVFGGEINIPVYQGLHIWLGGSYLTKKGELSYTQEETELQIIPLGGGLKMLFGSQNINFYIGGGLSYFMFKESNVIGEISEGGLGFNGKAGVYARPGGGIVFDVFIDYSNCSIEPADFKINIGGLAAGIGVGFEF